jgi:hypothetical protein
MPLSPRAIPEAICEQSNVLKDAVKQGGEAICCVASAESIEYDLADPIPWFSDTLEARCMPRTLNIPCFEQVATPNIG